MQAVVLAGKKAPEKLQELGVEYVFLLQRDGQTLLEQMCRALVEGGGCTEVFIRAPEEIELPDLPQVNRIPPVRHVIEDVMDASRDTLTSERIFIGAADVPLINAGAIAALKEHCESTGADFTYPVVSEHEMEKQYPGTQRTYLPFSGTRFTGGNVMVFRRNWMLGRQELVDYMFQNRKNPLALVSRIGLGFLLRIALKMASIEYAEASVGRLSGGQVVAARLPYPELALDLDKPEDLEFFRPYLDQLPE